jgi:O-antigen/teichoic acid export membrane protein
MSQPPINEATPLGPEMIRRDGRALASNTGYAALGQIVAIVAGLCCTILTIRLITKNAYGQFGLFFMLLELVSHLFSWPNDGLVQFGRDELARMDTLRKTFWARMILFIASAIVGAVLLGIWRGPLQNYIALDYPVHILLFFYVVLNGFVLLSQSVFQTASQYKAYAVTRSAVKVFNLLLILSLCMSASKATAGRILELHIVSFSMVSLLCLYLLPWKILLPVRINAPILRGICSYSWPLLPAGLSAFVVNWVDMAVIKQHCNLERLGEYTAAYQPVTILIILSMAMLAALLPLLVSLVRESRHDDVRWVARSFVPQCAWVVAACGAILIIGAEAIPIVLGADYAPAVRPCQILMSGMGFFFIGALMAVIAKAMGHVKWVFIVGLLTAITNGVLDILFVPMLGIEGAALATMAAFLVNMLAYIPLLLMGRVKSDARRHPISLLLWACIPSFALCALAYFCDDWPQRLCGAIAIFIMAGYGGRALGVFDRSTVARIGKICLPKTLQRILAFFYTAWGRDDESEEED